VWIFLLACQAKDTAVKPQASENEQVTTTPQNKGHELVLKMMEKTGSYEQLQELKDVEYQYIYKSSPTAIDVSIERYVFDGELSWAEYTTRENRLMTSVEGKVIQGFDGENTWVTVDGVPVTDENILNGADFTRKTNFYWFAMMQKLNDPGLEYAYLGDTTINEKTYDIVNVGFNNGVGDAQDDYTLFLNTNSHLADRFLFTVREYGIETPLLMEVKYTTHDGIRLPTYRRYAPLDADGQPIPSKWVEEISENIQFNNNFPVDMFKRPADS